MIHLLMSLANAHCSSNLSPPYTAVNIAIAIGELGDRDGRIFGAAVNGYPYYKIAAEFKVPVEYVVEIVRRGADIVEGRK